MLGRYKPDSAKSLRTYHDTLLFISAFPDSKNLADKSAEELLRIKKMLPYHGSKKTLMNSGMEKTVLNWKPSFDALQWLINHLYDFHFTVKSKKSMEELTALLCSKTEWDSLLDSEISFQQWIKLITGKEKCLPSQILKAWLNRFENLNATPAVRDYLFDNLSMKVTCTINGNWSLSSNKLLTGQPALYLKKPELKQIETFKPVYLNNAISERILNSIKAALFARQKETDPVTYADKRFLIGYETVDGFTVYLLSMKPEYRLPLESYIGFMVYSNGIPVSYGGGWIFYERCEFGINIFEQFRGGPSARILNVLINVYKHQYGIKKFIIPPYQFGLGNRDGIKSGAFWFYYKLGFRPVNKELKRLAEKEWKKIMHNSAYRTPEKTLLRFSESYLCLQKDNKDTRIPELKNLSRVAVKWRGKYFEGNQQEASGKSASAVLKKAGLTMRGWMDSEKKFFLQLAPFISIIPGWNEWRVNDLKQAVMVLKEKGNNEHRFISMLQQHIKLREGLNLVSDNA